MSNLAVNLKELRRRNNLTQQDVADYLRMSRVGYAKYENNKAEPTVNGIIKLADLYNVSIDDLLGRVTIEQTPLRRIRLQKETKDKIESAVSKGVEEFIRENKSKLKEYIKNNLDLG